MLTLTRTLTALTLSLFLASTAVATAEESSALPTSASPSDAEVDALVSAVESKYEGVQALRASFVQTTHSELFGDEQQVGTVVLKRPGKMRWDFTTGSEKQFITDGKTMWVYTKSDNQAIRYDNVGGTGGAMDSLLQSLDKLHELFSVEVLPKEGGHHLRLRPRSAEESRFKQVELELNADLTLDKVSITDAFDATTDLDFSAVELNVEAADGLFEFSAPAGVEVLSTGGLE
ncbi:MAG: outer membrane lipoprotein chaperone LolA [Deltaproteobacteria bacterium]|nr:outer membrane lipoprotein chaperone LolA [Deltaproteobacteria bacterium]